jgi:hypothetical protein
MARFYTLAALVLLPAAAIGGGPLDNVQAPGYYSGAAGAVGAAGPYEGAAGGAGGVLVIDPCERGTIFTALKVVRAYRDNVAFAFKHLEGKQLQISGRLVGVTRDKIVVNNVTVFEGFVALITPDGKAPLPPTQPFGLEFRFPLAALQADPQLACDLGNLQPGQFVTLRGVCVGPPITPEGEYIAIIFKDSQIVR